MFKQLWRTRDCLNAWRRCKQLSDAVPCNIRNTHLYAPGAKIFQVSHNSNQAAYVTIACRCSFGKGKDKKKQGNTAWAALTFNWILIESDRRLTLNEIHTGHQEQTTCEGQTNRGESCSHILTSAVIFSLTQQRRSSLVLSIKIHSQASLWRSNPPLQTHSFCDINHSCTRQRDTI